MGAKRGSLRLLSARDRRRVAETEGCRRRGESLRAYAERTGQSVHTLYAARKSARQAGLLPPRGGRRARPVERAAGKSESPFVEAIVRQSAVGRAARGSDRTWRLHLPSGAVLEGDASLAGVLERLVARLESAS